MNKVPLQSVAEIVMGTAPPGDSYNLTENGIPLIAGAGDYGEIHPKPKKWTTQPSATSRLGDLIICVRATIGDLNWSDREYCLGRGVAALRPKNGKLEPRFLGHYMEAKKEDLAALGTGSTFPAIRRGDIENFEIPLPPVSEQKRIADILDKADAIRRKRRETIKVSGEFVSGLFSDMFTSRSATSQRSTPFLALEDAIERFIDYRGKTPRKTASGIPLITAKVIKQGRILPPNEFIAEEDYDSWMTRGLPEVGDVLFTTEAPLGEIAQITETKVALAQRVLLMRGKTGVLDNTFLRLALKSPYVWNQIVSRSTGSTVVGIRQAELRQVRVPVPPLSEQRQFAKISQAHDASLARLRESQEISNGLFNALVQRAFRGEL